MSLAPPGGAIAQSAARLPGFVDGDPRFYCNGCGIEQATCDRYRREGKVCCPDCDHGKTRAPAFLASELVTLRAAITRLTAEREQYREDSDILRRSNIVEIAVRNDTGSVSEYMNHWEGRAVKAEAELTRLTAENEKLKAELNARYEWVAALAAPRAPDGETNK